MSEDSDAARAIAELARCREEIESIDHDLIGLLARRLALGRRTGELKRVAGLPILDPQREAAVIRRVTAEAREAGLPAEAVREVFWQIVGMSRRLQETTSAVDEHAPKTDARPAGGGEGGGGDAGEGST